MASLISSFSARSSWPAVGASLLPVMADQLVRLVFSKKLSYYTLETASLVTSGVTYLLLSRHLPDSFTIGAPILYLAYKAAHYYLSKQTPADSSAKDAPYIPYLPSHGDSITQVSPQTAATKPKEKTGPSSAPFVSPPQEVALTDVSAKPENTEPLPIPSSIAPTTEEKTGPSSAPSVSSPQEVVSTDVPAKPEKTESLPVPLPVAFTAEEKAAVEAGRLAAESFFKNIIAPFEKSQIMSLKIQIKPLPNTAAAPGEKPLKAETVKAKIRFGSTHVFKLDKTQVEALNKEGCDVTEKTLFFWINIAAPDNKGATINFIPLTMLDSLNPNASEFSLCLNEKNYQLILSFKQQLDRLTTLAKTMRTCRNVKVIHPGVVHPSGNPAHAGALLSNDLAAINRTRCYLTPFMKKA